MKTAHENTNVNANTDTAAELHRALNKQVADWSVLYTKLHNYHWYVKGSHFFTLHVKFEELYNAAAERLDEVAERLLTIGGAPAATLREHLELTRVSEAAGGETAEQMVDALIRDFRAEAAELEHAIEIAGALGDKATEDLLIGLQSAVEKDAWMLEAYLGR
ncbi:DNA starvation/stationary phase protection protein [Saccharibacillus sp. CPCC 101409]|uniref:Dps family protein n=1 Tax=Saccharibacillus sp. CPCC 101409 TaxID=3058041 RepID=UPI0026733D29|nr:DNA starvation/stationary phase protection protein [Saccharibacillus sp. CPCC 101409]MDO3410118.1 DNA starvation/stationary phase protection protein [Saccharibacillus sp. CPCC 101409]